MVNNLLAIPLRPATFMTGFQRQTAAREASERLTSLCVCVGGGTAMRWVSENILFTLICNSLTLCCRVGILRVSPGVGYVINQVIILVGKFSIKNFVIIMTTAKVTTLR